MGTYHSDKTIREEEEDLFNRSGFADDILKIISDLDNKESFVIGLYAKWGYGKTSTINLIDQKLQNRQEKDIYTICVNAWTLDGNISKIMWEILSEIYHKATGKKKKSFKHLFSQIGSALKTSDSSFYISMSDIANGLSLLESIESIKKDLDKLLNDKNIRLVIFIDDIDRLESHQIVSIFRMLSNVADYARITYILPFDKEFVCSAIEEHLPKKQSGNDYLEKIIQIPLHLPSIPQAIIDGVFIRKLTELLGEFSIIIDEKEIERFQILYYHYGANNYIQSPRDINKILNVLRFKVPINNYEVNIVDTIIIEIIRTFDESLYHKIRDNKKLLLGQVYKHEQYDKIAYLINENDDRKKSDEEIREEYARKIFNSHYQLINQLFPHMIITNSYDLDLRKLQRISSKNYFDIFFASIDKQNGISDKELVKLLNNAIDQKTVYAELKKIINIKNFDITLNKISDNKDLISNKYDFCKALLDILETIPKDIQPDFMLNPLNRTLLTINDILKQSKDKLKNYTELLKYNYDHDRFHTLPYMIAHIIAIDKSILQESDLQQYKQVALKIIQDMAKKNKMPIDSTEDFCALYYYWADFIDDKEEISDYIKRHVKTATQSIDFISQFLTKWSGSGNYTRGDLTSHIYEIAKFIDLKSLYNIIIADKEYQIYENIQKEDLQYFEHSYDSNIIKISKVGNEKTNEFRAIIAKQFIYLYKNQNSKSIAE